MAPYWLWPEDNAAWSSLCLGSAPQTHSPSLHQWALASRSHFVSISDTTALSNQSHTSLSEDRMEISRSPSHISIQGIIPQKTLVQTPLQLEVLRESQSYIQTFAA